jgi:hypothetical protein
VGGVRCWVEQLAGGRWRGDERIEWRGKRKAEGSGRPLRVRVAYGFYRG